MEFTSLHLIISCFEKAMSHNNVVGCLVENPIILHEQCCGLIDQENSDWIDNKHIDSYDKNDTNPLTVLIDAIRPRKGHTDHCHHKKNIC